MFDFDSKTAVNELVGVFNHPSVNLPRIASCLTEFINNVTRIVLLGESGSGKSSVGNFLLGRDPESSPSFKASTGTKSCTLQTKEIIGTWLGNGNLCAIVDTPGMNDSDNRDTEHMRNIVNFLKEISFVNCFLLVRNGCNPRMSFSFKRMLSTFELTFGRRFWEHTAINITRVKNNHKNIEEQNAEWKSEINSVCPDSSNAPLRSFVLDIEEESEIFRANAKSFGGAL